MVIPGSVVIDPSLLVELPEKGKGTVDAHSLHLANFIDCVKSRAEPRAPVEVGHSSAVLCHIANAAIRMFPESGPGKILKWDAEKEVFIDNDAANRMLVREQRDPWTS